MFLGKWLACYWPPVILAEGLFGSHRRRVLCLAASQIFTEIKIDDQDLLNIKVTAFGKYNFAQLRFSRTCAVVRPGQAPQLAALLSITLRRFQRFGYASTVKSSPLCGLSFAYAQLGASPLRLPAANGC